MHLVGCYIRRYYANIYANKMEWDIFCKIGLLRLILIIINKGNGKPKVDVSISAKLKAPQK